jgi:hypothetical protein
MRVNPIMLRDYSTDTWCVPINPNAKLRIPPDYSPRDKRHWLRKCLHVGCPIERCLDMPIEEPKQHGPWCVGGCWCA